MRWDLCILFLLILEQLTRVGALKLTLTTNPPQEQEGDVVLYLDLNRVPANLTCTVVDGDGGDENYLVAWYKNNAPITPSSSSVSSASLHFEKIELSDGGWYTCATLLGNQRRRLDFLLVVGGPPLFGENYVPSPYLVQERTRIEFPCFPQGTPRPTVEWFYQNGTDTRERIVDGDKFRISPTSQSLVIPEPTRRDLEGVNYICRANNTFGTREIVYNASITDHQPPPPTGPDFPFEGSDKLLAIANKSVNEVTLRCHNMTEARENDRFKWLGNGEQLTLPNTRDNILVERNERGSGFYCCEIYNSSSDVVVFDTYCVTLVFRALPMFVEPTLPVEERTFHLPQGTGAGFICYGGSSYDPPKLTWTGPDSQTKPNFTDMQGFAYAVVEGRSSDSGMYQCSGDNSVGNINGSVSLRYIEREINLEGSDFRNVLTESDWKANGDASIDTVMNEIVFLLPFSGAESIEDTWFGQNFTLTSDYISFSISGRVRQEQMLDIYPVIKLEGGDGNVLAVLEHPVRNAISWQWVERGFANNGTTTYTVKLALKTDSQNVSKRQASNGRAFFSDINVNATSSSPAEESEKDKFFIIILASSVGGGVLLAVVVAIVVLCLYCCRRGKTSARPMRKLTSYIKGTSQKYKKPSTKRSKGPDSPVPQEYEVPLESNTYATLQTHNRGPTNAKNNGEYTQIDPQSLDEPSYYKATHAVLVGAVDEGGVQTYLEVVPSVPTHRSSPGSSRGGSPIRPTALGTSAGGTKEPEDVASPDVLDGDSIEMYEYVNAGLGPVL